GLTDRPNERSLHTRPMPRFGGIAMITVALAVTVASGAASASAAEAVVLLCAGALALAVMGVVDDRQPVAVAARLAVHGAVSVLFVSLLAAEIAHRMPWSGWPAAVTLAVLALALAWSINLYNFMDGSDGLAGAMALIGFGCFALASPAGTPLNLLAGAVAGAAAGFLLFNWPPARLFMGDGGSVPIGFLAAGSALAGWAEGYWPAWFGPVVFAPFVIDASATLALRTLRGEPLWRAHRQHAYQKLNLLGLGHAGSLRIYLALMAACAVAALIGRRLAGPGAMALAVSVVALLVLGYGVVEVLWRRRPTA
ncbi:MAG: glycosyl transferase, partial [Burkholderiales bacterium]